MSYTFISQIANTVSWLKVNGMEVRVCFHDMRDETGRGMFRTDSKAVAEKIRSLKTFGDTITERTNRHAEEVKEEPKLKAVEEVTRTQEANKYLIDNFGIDKSELKDKATAIKVAASHGISFPNL